MKTGTLSIVENGKALRTRSINGQFHRLPKAGESFLFLSQPLGISMGIRVITTSVIKEIIPIKHMHSNAYRLVTQNSIYKLVVNN